MAKGNMLQGMARGKVGDVVFSRLNGEQIARVRNRNPKNPRTNAQLYQRAIMATVMQAYSAGKAIFDHSFQGFAAGEQNQRRFMSMNAKLLRQTLASDLNKLKANPAATTSQFGFVGPGVVYPAMNGIQVSEGKYPNIQFSAKYGLPSPNSNEKVKDYVARVGLVAGDIYTIVGFGIENQNDVVFEVHGTDAYGSKQVRTSFAFLRMQVKDGLDQVETVVTDQSTVSLFFNITGSQMLEEVATAPIVGTLEDPFVNNFTNGFSLNAATIIRSRLDQDLRSTSFLSNVIDDNTEGYGWYGISAKYLLDAWKQGTEAVGDSDLILEGGGE